jgi:integrase
MGTYVYPKIGKLNIAALDTALVKRCVEPIWQTKTATAKNVRRDIEGVWSWAKSLSYCSGENPARWEGHLAHQLANPSKIKKTKNHAALPYTDIAAFMLALQSKEGLPARALEMTVLTAMRTSEVMGALAGI